MYKKVYIRYLGRWYSFSAGQWELFCGKMKDFEGNLENLDLSGAKKIKKPACLANNGLIRSDSPDFRILDVNRWTQGNFGLEHYLLQLWKRKLVKNTPKARVRQRA